ncbi:divergent PAP2 family protein [Paenibacillus sp. BC26]|uniref:divergent PAP2 family protein n=1 Tax=Paenibacillus sp. BC26 TaxID=1881032 RepID=UPI0008ECC221|nr:divergent PAP2 family protein [Paenibacillus sp. BC26]SFS51881.1 hypothetical protein SAMN05428962_0557 [Paenibacillus sp. BC26]
MSVIHNYPLVAGLTAIIIAQIIKVPIYLITHRTMDFKLAFGTGGMPSSHSAAVTALSTAVGIKEGFESSMFAIACMVAVITMYDAAGIRRHAGEHASILNRIAKKLSMQRHEKVDPMLKEMLGHRPIEVFVGALFGIGISILLQYAYS